MEYIVKIYPFSGNLVGDPSVVRIPASGNSFVSKHEETETFTTEWQLHAPRNTPTSLNLRWSEPAANVQGN